MATQTYRKAFYKFYFVLFIITKKAPGSNSKLSCSEMLNRQIYIKSSNSCKFISCFSIITITARGDAKKQIKEKKPSHFNNAIPVHYFRIKQG